LEIEYDIFEVMPDGGVAWRVGGLSLGTAEVTILELGQRSSNEFFAIHVPSQEIIARVNHVSAPNNPAQQSRASGESDQDGK
jgi:hypothetical protein